MMITPTDIAYYELYVMMEQNGLYERLHYNFFPPVFMVFFTCFSQVATIIWKGESVCWESVLKGTIGNCFSWGAVALLILWALIWLWLTSRTVQGPQSPEGVVPVYKENGLSYYFASIAMILLLEHFNPGFSQKIYDNMSEILGTLNIIAFALCFYLFYTSKSKKDLHLPKLYLFYRGLDLYPKILNVQVKQLVNSRIGIMLWQLLPISYFIVLCNRGMFNLPAFGTLIIQSVYIFKFYLWESEYFHTLDVILDRAGYYICWGCMVWLPCFYPSLSYYFVHYVPQTSSLLVFMCIIVGVICTYIQYKIDREKAIFKKNNKAIIWGKPATYIQVIDEKEKRSRSLLTSGFWGVARHLNYTMEIIIAFSSSLPGYNLGIVPFLYPIFLTILLCHRLFRDEKKCQEQYGKYWNQYCTLVPYRLIPYLF